MNFIGIGTLGLVIIILMLMHEISKIKNKLKEHLAFQATMSSTSRFFCDIDRKNIERDLKIYGVERDLKIMEKQLEAHRLDLKYKLIKDNAIYEFIEEENGIVHYFKTTTTPCNQPSVTKVAFIRRDHPEFEEDHKPKTFRNFS